MADEVKDIKNIKTVSIITTFYNAQSFVLNAVNSIYQQDFDPNIINIEYIIVDDKSEDDSRKLVEQYILDHPKEGLQYKIVEPEKNLGCGGARKFGIENASGMYYMFLDADDYYIHTDFVERAVHDIEEDNADIVEYGIIFNQANGQQMNNTSPQKIVFDDIQTALVALYKDNLIKFNVWSKIYKKHIIDSYPYSTERTFEDVRTIPVWISNAKRVVIMPTPEINYRATGGSIIRNNDYATRLGTITAIAELFERFKDEYKILRAMYQRAMVDLEAVLHNHSSKDPAFNEMSKLNTYMLSYIYPDNYKEFTYNIDEENNGEIEKTDKK